MPTPVSTVLYYLHFKNYPTSKYSNKRLFSYNQFYTRPGKHFQSAKWPIYSNLHSFAYMKKQFAAGSKPELIYVWQLEILEIALWVQNSHKTQGGWATQLTQKFTIKWQNPANNKPLTNLHWLSHWMIYLHIHDHYNRTSNDDYISSLLSPCFIRQRGIR